MIPVNTIVTIPDGSGGRDRAVVLSYVKGTYRVEVLDPALGNYEDEIDEIEVEMEPA